MTGHTGFKGGWLSTWLTQLGAEVHGLSVEPPSTPNLYEAAGLASELTHHHGDIRDPAAVQAVFTRVVPDIVFHLAAQPLVRLSYQQPASTFETNVMGSLQIFEACRRTESVRALVNVTSDKCYENREWVWGYRESDPMGGHDPYSASKGCAELLFASWQRSFFDADPHRVLAASVRAGNVIGGGDWGADRLLPDCMRALSEGQTITLRSPAAVRPWQHVLEPLSGYLRVGAGLLAGEPSHVGAWNFGPRAEQHWSVEQVVGRVCELWGDGRYQVDAHPNPHEAHWLKLDCSKARIELGWSPRWSMERNLAETVEWYRAHHRGESPARLRARMLEQIEGYVETPAVT